MNKFTSFIENALMPLASKLSSNKYLKAISNGFGILLPVIMVGAIFTLLGNLQIDIYQSFVQATHLKEIFSFAPAVTTDMLALYAVFLIGKSLAENFEMQEKDATIAGFLSLLAFLLLIPLGVTGTEGDVTVTVKAALGTKWLGSAGLFSAMIVGLIVPRFYKVFKDKNIGIKMPESVPPTISKSFSALLPGFAIAFTFCVIRYLFSLTTYGSANQFIYSSLQKPLTNLGASPFTFLLFIVLSSLLWFFGLHGGMIIMPFLTMLYQSASLENLAAYAAGTDLPNVLTKTWWFNYASLGGAGGTLGLCILMVLLAKSKRYKTLGKLALPAGVCSINEPVTFGLPVVLNTVILIPFILAPVVTFGIAYILTNIGIVPILNGAEIPVGTPVILSGWITGGFRAGLLQLGLIGVQMLIYFPFFKILDKQAVNEEESEVQMSTDVEIEA